MTQRRGKKSSASKGGVSEGGVSPSDSPKPSSPKPSSPNGNSSTQTPSPAQTPTPTHTTTSSPGTKESKESDSPPGGAEAVTKLEAKEDSKDLKSWLEKADSLFQSKLESKLERLKLERLASSPSNTNRAPNNAEKELHSLARQCQLLTQQARNPNTSWIEKKKHMFMERDPNDHDSNDGNRRSYQRNIPGRKPGRPWILSKDSAQSFLKDSSAQSSSRILKADSIGNSNSLGNGTGAAGAGSGAAGSAPTGSTERSQKINALAMSLPRPGPVIGKDSLGPPGGRTVSVAKSVAKSSQSTADKNTAAEDHLPSNSRECTMEKMTTAAAAATQSAAQVSSTQSMETMAKEAPPQTSPEIKKKDTPVSFVSATNEGDSGNEVEEKKGEEKKGEEKKADAVNTVTASVAIANSNSPNANAIHNSRRPTSPKSAPTKSRQIGAIVTGAASGIGLATAKHLVDLGYLVVMVDRDEEKLKQESRDIKFSNANFDANRNANPIQKKSDMKFNRVHFIVVDVSNPADIDRLAGFCNELQNPARRNELQQSSAHQNSNFEVSFKYLVHVAGCDFITDLEAVENDFDVENDFSAKLAPCFNRAMDVNLRSVYLIIRALLPILKESAKDSGASPLRGPGASPPKKGTADPGAAIVAVSSINAHRSLPDYAAYAATKGGILSMCRQMAGDLAKYNIRVNTVSPGAVKTDLGPTSKKYEGDFAGNVDPDAPKPFRPEVHDPHGAALLGILPPESVAESIASMLFMRGVTGQDIAVDGGCSVIGTEWRRPFKREEEYKQLRL